MFAKSFHMSLEKKRNIYIVLLVSTQIIVLWSFISFNLKFQSKFPDSIKHDIASWSPAHGIRLECTCTVILNALGYIGFKVCLRSDYVSSQTFNTVTL